MRWRVEKWDALGWTPSTTVSPPPLYLWSHGHSPYSQDILSGLPHIFQRSLVASEHPGGYPPGTLCLYQDCVGYFLLSIGVGGKVFANFSLLLRATDTIKFFGTLLCIYRLSNALQKNCHNWLIYDSTSRPPGGDPPPIPSASTTSLL